MTAKTCDNLTSIHAQQATLVTLEECYFLTTMEFHESAHIITDMQALESDVELTEFLSSTTDIPTSDSDDEIPAWLLED